MNKKRVFNKICKNIKSIKIQGARNIAKAGFKAYKIIPSKNSRKKLLSLRSTEPMLKNVLKIADKLTYKQLVQKLKQNQEAINKNAYKLIKNNYVIFTHCHSSSVINALIYAKNKGKKFEVYNTETRPLYQGRKTAEELKKAKIKVTMFVDSAAQIALTKKQKTRKVNIVFFGADAITKKNAVNKVGSGMFAQIANANKIPVYIVADSLKFTPKKIDLEQRNSKEIWNKKIKQENFALQNYSGLYKKKNSKLFIQIKNPAFELIDKKFITGILSELGTLKYEKFVKEMKVR